ncbi:hypothetical protein ES708_13195 [subsurface metagenome]
MFKKLIKVVGSVLVLLAGLFFLVKYDVMGKFYDFTDSQTAEVETADVTPGRVFLIDEEGNEIELGNELEIVGEEEIEVNVIHNNYYEGTLVKIEDNKIYFLVDKEVQEGPPTYSFDDVEDYEVVFDIDTFSFEKESHCDALEYYGSGDEKDCYRFYSADELKFLVGKYLSVSYSVTEDPYTKTIDKGISFQPSFPLKSSIISFTQ